jgi:hypothetical protein
MMHTVKLCGLGIIGAFALINLWRYMPEGYHMFSDKYDCGEVGTFIISSNGLVISIVSLYFAWRFMKIYPSEVPLYYN